jgi:hypothetical protein
MTYRDPFNVNLPSSFDIAQRDDFFGFGNAIQAIDSITPKQRNPDGTVSSRTNPPAMTLASSGGTFFDLRSPSEIFAEMDVRLNQQRQHVLH